MQLVKNVGVTLTLYLVLSVCEVTSDSYYSSYFGKLLNNTQVSAYTSNGTLSNCTNIVATCNSTEPRRIDGSCNNLKYPTLGATRTPQFTHLPKVFNRTSSAVFDPKLSKSGQPLKLARTIRDKLVSDGKIPDDRFTHCITHFLVFYATDITNTKDTSNYVSWRPWCCEEAGKSDSMCAPNLVPDDDYVHRYSNIKCLNMTRPLTFQTSGCLANTTAPTRIVDATPIWDLSPIYGNVEEPVRRSYVNGTLATETVDDRVFPITTGSLLLGINFISIIFFWRFHNFIAGQLLEVNPTWSDNKTFSTAREINIACANQILYYELMPQLMGSANLTSDGVTASSSGFRDPYNSSVTPGVATETLIALRHLHKMQDGTLKYYNSSGHFINVTYPMVNLTSNVNVIKKNRTIDYVINGCTRQASGKTDDNIADSDILNMGLGSLQKSMDIMTNDLSKNRYFGIDSYVRYRNLCFSDNITSFDDLEGIVDTEMIDALKDVYNNVKDIDLLAGMWVEKHMEGGYVPPTFYCIVVKQLLRNIHSDRHWYERKTRPNAFTADQLSEIRKISVSRMICDISDSVTEIQPSAFILPGTDNEIVSCDNITQIDYSAWADT